MHPRAALQTCAGIAIGTAGALLAERVILTHSCGVSGWIQWCLLAGTLVLVLSAVAATALPARRAATVNPATALRVE